MNSLTQPLICAGPQPFRALRALGTLLLLAWLTLSWADGLRAQGDLKTVEVNLRAVNKIFVDASAKDPKNDGARNLRDYTTQVLEALATYRATPTAEARKDLLSKAEAALTEANRYNSENAIKTRTNVKELIKIVQSSTPVPGEAASVVVEDLGNAQATEADYQAETQVTADEGQTTVNIHNANSGMSNTTLYLLFGVYLIAMVGLGLILSQAHKKAMAKVADRVTRLEKQYDNLEFTAKSSPNEPEFLRIELSKKIEQLENNTASFLEVIDTRLNEVESRQSIGPQAYAAGSPEPSTAQVAELMRRLQRVEDRMAGYQTAMLADVKPHVPAPQPTPQPSAQPSPTAVPAQQPMALRRETTDVNPARQTTHQPNFQAAPVATPTPAPIQPAEAATPEARPDDALLVSVPLGPVVEAIEQSLERIGEQTDIPRLKHLIATLAPRLTVAARTQSLDGIDLGELAEAIQLAFVDSKHRADPADYMGLAQAARKANFVIEDMMSGRMAFSHHYAENIPFDEYRTLSRVKDITYPNHERVCQKIEGSELYTAAVKNMVLFTLRPAVLHTYQGVKSVLARGTYITKLA